MSRQMDRMDGNLLDGKERTYSVKREDLSKICYSEAGSSMEVSKQGETIEDQKRAGQ